MIYDGKLISVELITAMLEDYSRPRLMTDAEKPGFLQEYFYYSGWIPNVPTPTPTITPTLTPMSIPLRDRRRRHNFEIQQPAAGAP